MLLADRVAIVTGGAKGMGSGIALKFAAEGCSVAIVDIDIQEAEKVAAEIKKKGGKVLAIQCDVTDEKQVKATVDQVVKKQIEKSLDLLQRPFPIFAREGEQGEIGNSLAARLF